jgi:hypothetical protein
VNLHEDVVRPVCDDGDRNVRRTGRRDRPARSVCERCESATVTRVDRDVRSVDGRRARGHVVDRVTECAESARVRVAAECKTFAGERPGRVAVNRARDVRERRERDAGQRGLRTRRRKREVARGDECGPSGAFRSVERDARVKFAWPRACEQYRADRPGAVCSKRERAREMRARAVSRDDARRGEPLVDARDDRVCMEAHRPEQLCGIREAFRSPVDVRDDLDVRVLCKDVHVSARGCRRAVVRECASQDRRVGAMERDEPARLVDRKGAVGDAGRRKRGECRGLRCIALNEEREAHRTRNR